MARYRKKPVVVEAEQFWPEKKPWPKGVVRADWPFSGGENNFGLKVDDGNWVLLHPGDWIVTKSHGEQERCFSESFAATYEPEPNQ